MRFYVPYDIKQNKILAEVHSSNPSAFVIGAVDPNTDGNLVRHYFLGGSFDNNQKWLVWLKEAKYWQMSDEFPFRVEDIQTRRFKLVEDSIYKFAEVK